MIKSEVCRITKEEKSFLSDLHKFGLSIPEVKHLLLTGIVVESEQENQKGPVWWKEKLKQIRAEMGINCK